MMEQRIIWKVIKIGAGNSTHFFVQNDKLCKWLCNWMGYFLNVATLLSNESDFHNSDGLDTYPKSRLWGLEVERSLFNSTCLKPIFQLNFDTPIHHYYQTIKTVRWGMNEAVNLKSLLIVTWVLSLILSWPTFQV